MQNEPQAYKRLAEIGNLLAQAMFRLKSKETCNNRDFLLDNSATPSIHGDSLTTAEKGHE